MISSPNKIEPPEGEENFWRPAPVIFPAPGRKTEAVADRRN
jgi:hypothetical protein